MQQFGEWKKYLFKPLGISLAILFGGALVVIIASSMVPEPVLYVIEFLVGGAPIYLPVLGLILKFKKAADISSSIKRLEKNLEDAKKEYAETEKYLKQNAEVDIPPRFRQKSGIEYITKDLQAREFVTLEQAIFKCEEAMSRKDIPDFYLP